MKNTPIERHLIDETINEFQIVDFSKATIREGKLLLLYKQKLHRESNLSKWKWAFGTSSFCSRRKS